MFDFKVEWQGWLLACCEPDRDCDGTGAAARAWRIIARPRAPRGYRFIYNHHRIVAKTP